LIAYLVVFALSLLLSLVLTPLCIRLGVGTGIVARPGGRRQHVGLVPKLGGLVVLGAFVGGALISLAVRPWLPPPPEGPDPNEMRRFAAILVGTIGIGLFGLLDDKYELRSTPQYIAQVVVSCVAIAGLVFIERVRSPFTGEIYVFPWPMVWGLTLLWLMGMMNTVNFLDGLDGLAAGVATIVSVVLVVHMLRVGHYGPALLPMALIGAMLGFLPFNFYPAKIFLGSGAITLGYLIGTLSLVAGARVATVTLVMGIPIVDVIWQIQNRWRHGRSMSDGDRGHLHFRLQDLGWSQPQIVLLYWAFCALFGILALVVSSGLFKLVAIAGLGVWVTLTLAVLSRRTQTGQDQEPETCTNPSDS
jgi:UDP-GlcNAc:undecaprenyl-phosphate GlcNAc-1-phosphate transferase